MNWKALSLPVLLLLSATAADAQVLLARVTPATVSRVEMRFSNAFLSGGILAVVSDIKSCYAATTDERTVANALATATCLLYDDAAVQLNESMTQALVGEGLPGAATPPTPGTAMAYLTRGAFAARLGIYATIPFGNDTQAFDAYFGNAPNIILAGVERDLERSNKK